MTSVGTREEDLLAAIYAAPHEDGPRGVYSDWLSERGDPRGEFIALQLSAAREAPDAKSLARARSLEKKHRAAWLGPVWDLVYRVPFRGLDRDYSPLFERGFLAEAVTNFRDGKLRKAAGDPRWSTVHTLFASDSLIGVDGSLWPEARAFYLHDVFRSLERLSCCHPEIAIALLEDTRPRRLRALGVERSMLDGDDEWAVRVRDAWKEQASVGLSELRELAIGATDPRPDRFEWLWSSPAGAKLETLRLFCGAPQSLDGWTNAVPSSLRVVELIDRMRTVTTLRREPNGEWSESARADR